MQSCLKCIYASLYLCKAIDFWATVGFICIPRRVQYETPKKTAPHKTTEIPWTCVCFQLASFESDVKLTIFLSSRVSSSFPMTNDNLASADSTVMSFPGTTPNLTRPWMDNETEMRPQRFRQVQHGIQTFTLLSLPLHNIPPTCSTYSVETSCGPPRQGQHVTMATPLSTAPLMASTRSVLESGILPLPYVTKTTPSIGDSKHPFIFSKKKSHDHRWLKTMFTSEFFGHKNSISLSAQGIGKASE